MQPHKPACEECQDTGSLSKTLWGALDCTHCPALAKRMILMDMMASHPAYFTHDEALWFGYMHGQQAQQEKLQTMAMHLRRMWGWAIQIGEQFRDGDDTERADWRKQCDEAIALLREYSPQQQSKLEE